MNLSSEEQISKFTLCEESWERAVKMQIPDETLFQKKKNDKKKI